MQIFSDLKLNSLSDGDERLSHWMKSMRLSADISMIDWFFNIPSMMIFSVKMENNKNQKTEFRTHGSLFFLVPFD
jgi:hypothetical protein